MCKGNNFSIIYLFGISQLIKNKINWEKPISSLEKLIFVEMIIDN